jgi:hypothetical protein
MLILRQKTLDQLVRSAVADAVADIPTPRDREPEISALRDEIEQLRADLAERETESARDLESRLLAEREVQAAAVFGVQKTVNAVYEQVSNIVIPQSVQREIVFADPVAEQAWDLATYLLDSPAQRVIEQAPQTFGILAVSEQHQSVRPMGAR